MTGYYHDAYSDIYLAGDYPDEYSDDYVTDPVIPPVVPPAAVTIAVAAVPVFKGFRWHVVNSLTGAILGRISPSRWEITEPLREPSTGTITVPLPADLEDRQQLRDLIRPAGLRSFDRSICLEQDGQIIFGGPIISRPSKNGPEVAIPVVDWRSWFYACPIRPIGTTFQNRRNKVYSNFEQCQIMTSLALAALENSQDPPIVIDARPTSGITRNLTAKMFQGSSIGEWLDDITKRDRGCEWWTYCVLSADGTKIIPHFAVAWPERRTTTQPLRITYRDNELGGDASAYAWPQNIIAPTRVWAISTEEDTGLWSQATSATIAAGTDLLWETVINLDDGTTKKADAFARAKGALKRLVGHEGALSVTVIAENLVFSSYGVGDRVRLRIVDDWENVDTKASRITQRVISGGAGEPTQQVLTIDITDDQYPDRTMPGSPVSN